MNFRLDIADSGELLKRFGTDGVVRRGKGRMEGQLAWTGSPLSPDIPTLSGEFNVNIEGGQFLKADPVLRELGVEPGKTEQARAELRAKGIDAG